MRLISVFPGPGRELDREGLLSRGLLGEPPQLSIREKSKLGRVCIHTKVLLVKEMK